MKKLNLGCGDKILPGYLNGEPRDMRVVGEKSLK